MVSTSRKYIPFKVVVSTVNMHPYSAVQKCRDAEPFALVLMDVQMARMDGRGVRPHPALIGRRHCITEGV